jgi:hypothetical protein
LQRVEVVETGGIDMANDVLTNLKKWCERERANLNQQLKLMQDGNFQTSADDGTGRKDTTKANIDLTIKKLAELEKLLADHQ